LHALKLIYQKYSAWLVALLQPLGAFGIFVLAFIDAAAFGMPLDPMVAWYVYNQRRFFWAYVIMAAAGSALGSLVIYVIGYKGGELLLHSKMSKQRVERMRQRFEEHEFLALMVPSMLPPPTPFKLFLLAASVFEMSLRDYLLAIFFGRLIRFSILAVLTLWIGPQVIAVLASLIREHLGLTIAIFCAGVALIVWYIVHRKVRSKKDDYKLAADERR
jgi:membrane protein YqaA with SNARE-associated domain